MKRNPSFLAILFVSATTTAASAAMPAIGDSKYGNNSNSVTMTILAKGNLQPMNAVVSQRNVKGDVILEIVEGGSTPPKAVEVVHGTCDAAGPTQYRLPPFKGGQYQAVIKNAQLSQLEDGHHAIVVYGGRRSHYACGDLVQPNFLHH